MISVFNEASVPLNTGQMIECVLSAFVCLLGPLISGPTTHLPTTSKQSPHGSGFWYLVLHACTVWMLQASGAGGSINECDQCCQVVEGDQGKIVAPQWDVWVICNSPQLLKGNCVTSDMPKPDTDSQLWQHPVHRRDYVFCLSCGCVVLPDSSALVFAVLYWSLYARLAFLFGLCFDMHSKALTLKESMFFQVSGMDTKTCTIRLVGAYYC